jgi:hypothetical protein
MNRWESFEYNKEDAPQAHYEAAVFLCRVASHIKQGGWPAGALALLNEAHRKVNDEYCEAVKNG